MKFSLENQGGNTFLTCEVSPSDQMDDIALAMLTSNKIPGLAPVVYSQIDGVSVIRYNISSRMQAKRLMSGMVNKNVLLGIFRSVCQAFSAVADYMIPTEMLLLDLEYIYVDTVTYDGVLICLPTAQNGAPHTDMRTFFRTTMFSVMLDKSDDQSYFIDIMNYLNSTENFSVERFLEVLNTADSPEPQQAVPEKPVVPRKEPVAPKRDREVTEAPQQPEKKAREEEPKKAPPPRQDDYVYEGINIPGHARTAPAEVDPPEEEDEASQKISVLYLLRHFDKDTVSAYKEQQSTKKKKKEKKSASPQTEEDFASPFQQEHEPKPEPKPEPPRRKKAKAPVRPEHEETRFKPQYEPEDTMDSDETVIDETSGESSQENASAYLVRIASQERIYIDTPTFRIGRSEVDSEYCITGNKKVSRKHAKIICRNGRHFLIDVGSNNHTYVNGDPIASNIEVELQDGDKIRFANEKFEFFLIERPALPHGAD